MANISSWLGDVSNKVPGATKIEIDAVLRTVVREFCTKTLLDVRELDPINVVAGNVTYDLHAPDANTSIVGVERCEVNGLMVPGISEDLQNRSAESWRQQELSQPTGMMVDAKKVLRLKQIPTLDITDGLVVWVSVKPAPLVDEIADFIYDDWYDCIMYGALAKLFKTPSQTWTNIQLGAFYENEYKGEWTKAKGQKITGKAKMSLRVQAPPFNVV